MDPSVTVAVVSWNTRDLLANCLESLRAGHERGLADVWVIDNGSSDGSPALVRERFGWASLIESERNLGFGPAVNEVARRATAPWIAPANADIELAHDALDELLAAGERDPKAGIVAPRLVLPDGTTQHSVHCFPSLGSTVLGNLVVERWSPRIADRLCLMGHWDSERARRVDWAHGAFLLVRREAFDASGGFEEERWMYGEDVDLSWRLAERGWATRYEPAARVRHSVSASTEQAWGDDRKVREMVATYGWIEARRGWLAARAMAAINIAGLGIRAAVVGAVARLTGSEKARAECRRLRWHLRLHKLGLRRATGASPAIMADP
jgi:GT2 family glycosyltransferase